MLIQGRRSFAAALFTLTVVLVCALPGVASAQAGYHSLFIGHSFFVPMAYDMPFHAAQAGIVGHTQSVFFSGGATGAPEALWNDPVQGPAIRAVLDVGDVELFVMTYHPTYLTTTGYEDWIDYALANNPNTRIVLALPWSTNPGSVTAATYSNTWLSAHDTAWHDFVDTLRGLYPGVVIDCIPYGRASGELYLLFDAGNLPDVTSLVGASGDAIYTDAFGHAGDILVDLSSLVWLNAIYDVDLNTYGWNPGTVTDLKALGQTIMDEHRAAFGPAPVPGLVPFAGSGVLVVTLLATGARGVRSRRRATEHRA